MIRSISNMLNPRSGSNSREPLACIADDSVALLDNTENSPVEEATRLTSAGWEYEISPLSLYKFSARSPSMATLSSQMSQYAKYSSHTDLSVKSIKDQHVMFFMLEKIGHGCLGLSLVNDVWIGNVYTCAAFMSIQVDKTDINAAPESVNNMHSAAEAIIKRYLLSPQIAAALSRDFIHPGVTAAIQSNCVSNELAVEMTAKAIHSSYITKTSEPLERALRLAGARFEEPLNHIIVDVILDPGFTTSKAYQSKWEMIKPMFGIPAQDFIVPVLSKSPVFVDLELVSRAITPPPKEQCIAFKHNEENRKNILKELLKLETSCLEKMKAYQQEIYMATLNNHQKSGFTSLLLAKRRFPSIEALISRHEAIVADIQKHENISVLELANIYSTHVQSLEIPYISYSKEFYIVSLVDQPDSQEFIEFIQRACKKISKIFNIDATLNSLMIVPIQRIPQLVSTFNRLLQNTAVDHVDMQAIQKTYDGLSHLALLIDRSTYKESQQSFLFAMDKAIGTSGQMVSSGTRYVYDIHASRLDSSSTTKVAVSLILFNNFIIVLSRQPAIQHKGLIRSSEFVKNQSGSEPKYNYTFSKKYDLDCIQVIDIDSKEFRIVEQAKHETGSDFIRIEAAFEANCKDDKDTFLRRFRHYKICRSYAHHATTSHDNTQKNMQLFVERYADIDIYYNLIETNELSSKTRRDVLCVVCEDTTNLQGILEKSKSVYNSAGIIKVVDNKFSFVLRTTAESEKINAVVSLPTCVRPFTEYNKFKPELLLSLLNVSKLCGLDSKFRSTNRYIQTEQHLTSISKMFPKVSHDLNREKSFVRRSLIKPSRTLSTASNFHPDEDKNASGAFPVQGKPLKRSESILSRTMSIMSGKLFRINRHNTAQDRSKHIRTQTFHTNTPYIPRESSGLSITPSFIIDNQVSASTTGTGTEGLRAAQTFDHRVSIGEKPESIVSKAVSVSVASRGGIPAAPTKFLSRPEMPPPSTAMPSQASSFAKSNSVVMSEMRIQTGSPNILTRSWRTMTVKTKKQVTKIDGPEPGHTILYHGVDIVEYGSYDIVLKLAEYIENHGRSSVGVYRNHGNADKLLASLKQFPEMALKNLSLYGIDDIATALKITLNPVHTPGLFLPEPFKSNILYAAEHETSDSELVPHFTAIFKSMCFSQRKFCHALLRHWRIIMDNSHVNKTTGPQLATALLPYIINHPLYFKSTSKCLMDVSVIALECLIWNYDLIFAEEAELENGSATPIDSSKLLHDVVDETKPLSIEDQNCHQKELSFILNESDNRVFLDDCKPESIKTEAVTKSKPVLNGAPTLKVDILEPSDSHLSVNDIQTCVQETPVLYPDTVSENHVSHFLRKKLLENTESHINAIGELKKEINTITQQLHRSMSDIPLIQTATVVKSSSDSDMLMNLASCKKQANVLNVKESLNDEIELDDEPTDILGRGKTLVSYQPQPNTCAKHSDIDSAVAEATSLALLDSLTELHIENLKQTNTHRDATWIDISQPLNIAQGLMDEITEGMCSRGIEMKMSEEKMQQFAFENQSLIAKSRVLKQAMTGLEALKASLSNEFSKDMLASKPTTQLSMATLQTEL
ncbi:hypothetical protein BDV3_001864 [Batrachochytrium dendrobatidis]